MRPPTDDETVVRAAVTRGVVASRLTELAYISLGTLTKLSQASGDGQPHNGGSGRISDEGPGTRLASSHPDHHEQSSYVADRFMRRVSPEHSWICHWSEVAGPPSGNRPTRALVWICEYPYRTMRTEPCEDCPNRTHDSLSARPDATSACAAPSKLTH